MLYKETKECTGLSGEICNLNGCRDPEKRQLLQLTGDTGLEGCMQGFGPLWTRELPIFLGLLA